MWVMNQEETTVIETNYLKYTLDFYEKPTIIAACPGGSVIAGTYESEERAKEIVKSFILSIQNGKTTFWMPKE